MRVFLTLNSHSCSKHSHTGLFLCGVWWRGSPDIKSEIAQRWIIFHFSTGIHMPTHPMILRNWHKKPFWSRKNFFSVSIALWILWFSQVEQHTHSFPAKTVQNSELFKIGFHRQKQYAKLLREISSTSFIYELQLLRTAFKRYDRVDFRIYYWPKIVPSVCSLMMLIFLAISYLDFWIWWL